MVGQCKPPLCPRQAEPSLNEYQQMAFGHFADATPAKPGGLLPVTGRRPAQKKSAATTWELAREAILCRANSHEVADAHRRSRSRTSRSTQLSRVPTTHPADRSDYRLPPAHRPGLHLAAVRPGAGGLLPPATGDRSRRPPRCHRRRAQAGAARRPERDRPRLRHPAQLRVVGQPLRWRHAAHAQPGHRRLQRLRHRQCGRPVAAFRRLRTLPTVFPAWHRRCRNSPDDAICQPFPGLRTAGAGGTRRTLRPRRCGVGAAPAPRPGRRHRDRRPVAGCRPGGVPGPAPSAGRTAVPRQPAGPPRPPQPAPARPAPIAAATADHRPRRRRRRYRPLSVAAGNPTLRGVPAGLPARPGRRRAQPRTGRSRGVRGGAAGRVRRPTGRRAAGRGPALVPLDLCGTATAAGLPFVAVPRSAPVVGDAPGDPRRLGFRRTDPGDPGLPLRCRAAVFRRHTGDRHPPGTPRFPHSTSPDRCLAPGRQPDRRALPPARAGFAPTAVGRLGPDPGAVAGGRPAFAAERLRLGRSQPAEPDRRAARHVPPLLLPSQPADGSTLLAALRRRQHLRGRRLGLAAAVRQPGRALQQPALVAVRPGRRRPARPARRPRQLPAAPGPGPWLAAARGTAGDPRAERGRAAARGADHPPLGPAGWRPGPDRRQGPALP